MTRATARSSRPHPLPLPRRLALQAILPALLAGGLGSSGCSQDFPQEMEIQPDQKIRPLGVVCEPAEAIPGETVRVTLRYYDPSPAATASAWSLALDYRLDRYDTLEYEGHVIDLAPLTSERRIEADADGIVTESFLFAVPETCLLVSSAVPEVIEIDLPPEVEPLFSPAGAYPTREEVDACLASVDPSALTAAQLGWLRTCSDLFACQIRLRCALRGALHLDVTRNLTVRYSRRLGSPNANLNPRLTAVALIDVHSADVDDRFDIARHPSDTTCVYAGDPAAPVAQTIEVRAGHTYFLQALDEKQPYVSPAGIRHDENHFYSWYYTRRHDAPDDLYFIQGHDGDEYTDMGPMDEIVRIVPPPAGMGPQRYLLHLLVRDERPEWRMYQGTPGSVYARMELLLTPS